MPREDGGQAQALPLAPSHVLTEMTAQKARGGTDCRINLTGQREAERQVDGQVVMGHSSLGRVHQDARGQVTSSTLNARPPQTHAPHQSP